MMKQKTIQSNLDKIEKLNGFLKTLIEKTQNDNVNLKLGDQLRPTEDYNGSLFEVVREPYWCYLDEKNHAHDLFLTQQETYFGDEKEEAQDFYDLLNAQKVSEDGTEDGVLSLCLNVGKDRVYEDSPRYEKLDDEDEKQDIEGRYYVEVPSYSVVWTERKKPENWTYQRRVWIRKICMISKAEGLSDDKNSRALAFPIHTFPFKDLIRKEYQKLSKISRSLELTQKGAKYARKICMASRNRTKLEELLKLWMNPEVNDKMITGFYSLKYGLFLKSDVKYEVSTKTVNPLSKIVQSAVKMNSELEEDGQDLEAEV